MQSSEAPDLELLTSVVIPNQSLLITHQRDESPLDLLTEMHLEEEEPEATDEDDLEVECVAGYNVVVVLGWTERGGVEAYDFYPQHELAMELPPVAFSGSEIGVRQALVKVLYSVGSVSLHFRSDTCEGTLIAQPEALQLGKFVGRVDLRFLDPLVSPHKGASARVRLEFTADDRVMGAAMISPPQ